MKCETLPLKECCGCSACAVACPKAAIRMEFDSTGTYRPIVQADQCVDCGICIKVCTVLNASDNAAARPLTRENVYISAAKNRNVLQRSSSGGVAHVFAQKAIEREMPVCGAGYDVNLECAAHTVCHDAEALKKLQGSKYLQSANEAAFREILKGESGLIIGTPCQIAAAEAVLKRTGKRDRFVLVDIFCHGVPNQLLWKNHLQWLRGRGKIGQRDIPVFRQGKDYRLKIGNYNAWYNEDAFYTFFLRGWMRNRRCYECHLRRSSCADIRIGDCMVEKYDSLNFSPSCVLVNTEAGALFLESCRDELELYPEEYSVVDGIQEKGSAAVPAQYERWLSALQNGAAPEQLIRGVMRKGRIKSFIKHDVLRWLREKDGSGDLKGLTDAEGRRRLH